MAIAHPALNVPPLYLALDTQRRNMGLTWQDVAAATQLSRSTFTRMRFGGRPDADGLVAILQWLGHPSPYYLHDHRTRETTLETDLIAVLARHPDVSHLDVLLAVAQIVHAARELEPVAV